VGQVDRVSTWAESVGAVVCKGPGGGDRFLPDNDAQRHRLQGRNGDSPAMEEALQPTLPGVIELFPDFFRLPLLSLRRPGQIRSRTDPPHPVDVPFFLFSEQNIGKTAFSTGKAGQAKEPLRFSG